MRMHLALMNGLFYYAVKYMVTAVTEKVNPFTNAKKCRPEMASSVIVFIAELSKTFCFGSISVIINYYCMDYYES